MKHKDHHLSTHFTADELACHGEDCCEHTVVVHPYLLLALEALRARIGKLITVKSGFRCNRHNLEVGGKGDSYHCKGMAADITVSGMRPDVLASEAKRVAGIGGVGVYSWGVHVDVGEKRSWVA
jgi:uncharacterized protein YcbK (DUF882 family)